MVVDWRDFWDFNFWVVDFWGSGALRCTRQKPYTNRANSLENHQKTTIFGDDVGLQPPQHGRERRETHIICTHTHPIHVGYGADPGSQRRDL